jgi:hypothetical protein
MTDFMALPLSGERGNGRGVLLSTTDYERIVNMGTLSKPKKLCMIKAGYVMIWDEGKIQYLHRWLFNLTTNDKSTHVDHISGDKLDCRRANLRLGSRSDNMCNIKKMMKPNLSSKFKGVSKSGQFYNAQITKDKVVLDFY